MCFLRLIKQQGCTVLPRLLSPGFRSLLHTADARGGQCIGLVIGWFVRFEGIVDLTLPPPHGAFVPSGPLFIVHHGCTCGI